MTVEYSHNDYLQILTDSGIVGGVIALWFIVLLFRAVGRAMKSTDPVLRSFALAGGAAIVSVLIHSLFDFNLQIPSNVLLFLVLTAVISRMAAIVDVGSTALHHRVEPKVAVSRFGVSQ
jgi:O-antigen ligase